MTPRIDVFTERKIEIAEQTLKMPDAIANVLGGPSKHEALETLAKLAPRKLNRLVHDGYVSRLIASGYMPLSPSVDLP